MHADPCKHIYVCTCCQWLYLLALDQLSLRCGPAANVTRVRQPLCLLTANAANTEVWYSAVCLQAQMPEDMMAESLLAFSAAEKGVNYQCIPMSIQSDSAAFCHSSQTLGFRQFLLEISWNVPKALGYNKMSEPLYWVSNGV